MDCTKEASLLSGVPLGTFDGRRWLEMRGWKETEIMVFIFMAPFLMDLGLEVCIGSFLRSPSAIVTALPRFQ